MHMRSNQTTKDYDRLNQAEYRHCSNIRDHFPGNDCSDSAKTFSYTNMTIVQLGLTIISHLSHTEDV